MTTTLEEEMASRKSNVHPDYYKTRGREPVGQEPIHQTEKAAYARMRSRVRTQDEETLPVRLEKRSKTGTKREPRQSRGRKKLALTRFFLGRQIRGGKLAIKKRNLILVSFLVESSLAKLSWEVGKACIPQIHSSTFWRTFESDSLQEQEP
jgi:hypothetical protein